MSERQREREGERERGGCNAVQGHKEGGGGCCSIGVSVFGAVAAVGFLQYWAAILASLATSELSLKGRFIKFLPHF